MHPFEQQLGEVVSEYEDALERSRHDDASDVLTKVMVRDLQTRCLAAIQRASGRSSVYFENADSLGKTRDNEYNHLAAQIGVAKSLLSDIKNDYLRSAEELIHGEVFADFLEMADHLVESGFKDAAAVIAGSTLETHLRQMCVKHSIATVVGTTLKKADTLNAELTKAGAYAKLDQKNVTAWLGLRNDAAHGNYNAYDKNQVRLFVSSVRDFITRHPA